MTYKTGSFQKYGDGYLMWYSSQYWEGAHGKSWIGIQKRNLDKFWGNYNIDFVYLK